MPKMVIIFHSDLNRDFSVVQHKFIDPWRQQCVTIGSINCMHIKMYWIEKVDDCHPISLLFVVQFVFLLFLSFFRFFFLFISILFFFHLSFCFWKYCARAKCYFSMQTPNGNNFATNKMYSIGNKMHLIRTVYFAII